MGALGWFRRVPDRQFARLDQHYRRHMENTIPRMADLFDDYRLGAAWDEMIAADGSARPPYRAAPRVDAQIAAESRSCQAGVESLARLLCLNQGVTFDVGGEERPFPLDIVPRIIDDVAWQTIERGVRQSGCKRPGGLPRRRSTARPRAVKDGVVPAAA